MTSTDTINAILGRVKSIANEQAKEIRAAHEQEEAASTSDSSLQPLGPSKVMVVFETDVSVTVTGAYVNGELVEADAFSDETLRVWTEDIERERESDARMAEECAEEARQQSLWSSQ